MSHQEPGPGRANLEGEGQNTGGEPGAGAAAPAPVVAGAPPSNTAYANSMEGGGEESFRLLLRGCDSLYLSYQGKLKEKTEKDLVELRDLARSMTPTEQAKAQLRVGKHVFEVLDKGSGYYPFGLIDNAFRIRLASRMAKQIPVASVQLSSEFLAGVGIDEAARQLRDVLGELVDDLGGEKVSRADLFADFVTNARIEQVQRDHWVSRADNVVAYWGRSKLTGWTIGLGGPIAARLYDKTLEVEEKSHKYYFHEIWERAGWIPTDDVWRLEFELKRNALGAFGIQSIEDLQRSAGSLWRYLTSDWSRLAIPNAADETRSRWPNHPLWTAVHGIAWDGNQELTKRPAKETRAPGNEWFLGRGSSLLASFMAREGISDTEEGWKRLGDLLGQVVACYPEKYGVAYDGFVLEKVQAKRRQYNTALNVEREPGEDDEEVNAAAAAYRKASRGE